MAASGWNLLADLVSDTQAVQVPPSADLPFLDRYINGVVQRAVSLAVSIAQGPEPSETTSSSAEYALKA